MADTIKSRLADWVQTVDREFTLGEAGKKYQNFGGSPSSPYESALGAVGHMITCTKKGPLGGTTTPTAVYVYDPEKHARWKASEAELTANMAKWEAEREVKSIWHRIEW